MCDRTYARMSAPNKVVLAVQTVKHVELNKFEGLWYEQARYDIYAERGMINVTSYYHERGPDGSTAIHSEDSRGIILDVNATADDTSCTKWTVRFSAWYLSWMTASYWIIALGPVQQASGLSGPIKHMNQYSWAVVGTPSRDALWIMSRGQYMTPYDMNTAITAARREGFKDKMIFGTSI